MPVNLDANNEIATVTLINPAALKTTTTTTTGIDLSGFMAVCVVIHNGVITDGTHTPTIEESDTLGSGYTTATAITGTLTALTSGSTAGATQEIAYQGGKRYIRLVMTVTGSPSTGGFYSALAIKFDARTGPV